MADERQMYLLLPQAAIWREYLHFFFFEMIIREFIVTNFLNCEGKKYDEKKLKQ